MLVLYLENGPLPASDRNEGMTAAPRRPIHNDPYLKTPSKKRYLKEMDAIDERLLVLRKKMQTLSREKARLQELVGTSKKDSQE